MLSFTGKVLTITKFSDLTSVLYWAVIIIAM